MDDNLTGFSRTARSLARNPLGIIALFIVLVYGLASLVTAFGTSLPPQGQTALVYFLVSFPVLVLVAFYLLVTRHADKLYGPRDYRDEENFVRVLTGGAYLAAAAARRTTAGAEPVSPRQIRSASRELSRLRGLSAERGNGRILWVDDHPTNNLYERKAFEALGVSVDIALSTTEALHKLERSAIPYDVIISDMGRAEGPREGYALLTEVRRLGYATPLFIYTGSSSLEHRREAAERGAQGSTNDPWELSELVTEALQKRA